MTDRNGTSRDFFTALALLWLSGVALRLTILAVPPAIPLIHADLHLSATQIGILTGLPSLLFACAAVPGALLIARLGIRSALLLGLLANALGGALRGAITDVWWLYAMTIAMGAGVAVMQVSMPTAVRAWAPRRIGFATAIYTNGLLIGEILPIVLMIPLTLPIVGTWQRGFAFWSVPVLIIAVLIALLAKPATMAPRRNWWPDWSDPLVWRLGILIGCVNAMYFASNAFLPDYLTSRGEAAWIGAALNGLNLGQLPASFMLLPFAGKLERTAWPYAAFGMICVLAVAGIVFTSGWWVVLATSLIGFAAAGVLILGFALPALLAAPDDVHRLAGAMFTISYTCAVLVPVVSGALWDLTGIPATAFAPIALCGIVLMALAHSVRVKPRKAA
ncbi:MAG: MFS transporter [Pseudolabrys sp.]|nr:MFS transporter [Pseudolabrys sp.]